MPSNGINLIKKKLDVSLTITEGRVDNEGSFVTRQIVWYGREFRVTSARHAGVILYSTWARGTGGTNTRYLYPVLSLVY